MIYDAAIIGTGPAGVSAALNLKILEKHFIWLGSRELSDKITKAECISNYPGFPQVTGKELNQAFQRHMKEMGIGITEQMVNSILPMGDHYALMAGREFYEARGLILATGVANTVTLPGESGLIGRGVSYCATCDGNLYRDKTIGVICNAPRFEHEVEYLAGLAAKVYYFPQYPNGKAAGANVEILGNRPVEILGDMRAQGIRLDNGETVAVDGVFCLRNAIALSTLLPGLEAGEGHIHVDAAMATNLPGVYAAGDCTGRPYQYAKAVGEGNVAAHSLVEYLARKEIP